jgi:thioredoxin reductase
VAIYDVIVVGGGPAGVSAALMLGRCRRRVLLCDRGEPRNERSAALHGYLTRDGISPAAFRTLARRELAPYGIEFLGIAVKDARRHGRGFDVALADGRRERSRFLLLATGVRDELPSVAGITECYGRSVFHCPYCDGWEWRDRRLAVLGRAGVPLALSLKTWSPSVVLCSNGGRVDPVARQRLTRNGVDAKSARVARLTHRQGMVSALEFADGERLACDAVFFTTRQYQQDTLAARLGCSFTHKGTVNTGTLCETNVGGVFVAGDASRDAQFVVVAAAEGVKAAMAINQALQREELRP